MVVEVMLDSRSSVKKKSIKRGIFSLQLRFNVLRNVKIKVRVSASAIESR